MSTDRQVKGSLAKVVLSYVRRILGDDAVAKVLADAERHRPQSGIEGAASWTSSDYVLAVAEAAAEACGEVEIGRRSGEELFRMQRERGTIDFLVGTGSVEAALALAANGATKMSSGRRFELEDAGPFRARIISRYAETSIRHAFFCGQASGYFGAVPGAFGFDGVVAEVRCQCRGDERCVYEIRWYDLEGLDNAADEERVAQSRVRAYSFVERFEQLHLMATDLASAEEVDTLLARIADRAGLAIDAPRYLLAVTPDEDGQVRIFHKGFDPSRADRFAARLLAGEIIESDTCVVVPAASASRLYGKFVATYPEGSVVTEMERRLLAAYARHAAAALESVAALGSARRDRDTARALLDLATALAEIGGRDDVAARLALAVSGTAASAVTCVWLVNEVSGTLELVASEPSRPVELGEGVRSLRLEDLPELAGVQDHPTAIVLDADAHPAATSLLTGVSGVRTCAVVPITARGSLMGFVVAGFDEERSTFDFVDRSTLGVLKGLAGQAATALVNAALVQRIKEQALHDALTGLPNRKLLEDRVDVALAQREITDARVSLLFIDLDGFKPVNDTLGHSVGDLVIREASQRLAGCLRHGDTLARLGGDEFVAMLPRLGPGPDVERVAQRMIDALNEPFDVGGHSISISCSIGIATSPDHGTDYLTLLQGADAAMYAAKQLRQGAYSVHTT